MCLDTGLVEGGSPTPHGDVRVLSEEEVYLFEGTTVCLYTVKASHVDDGRCNFFKLVNPGHVFAG